MGILPILWVCAVMVLILLAVMSAGYIATYLALRCFGKLSVNAGGWHAGSVDLGRRVVLPALRLFGFFQPLMRWESAVARKLWHRRPREQGVSEVTVELVRLV